MQPYPYQRAGADALKANTRFLLADEMGLGKTVQAIIAAKELGLPDVRVVCPAVAVNVWEREFKAWAPEMAPKIMSYDRTVAHSGSQMRKGTPDVLILDEAHYLKSPQAKRTQSLYGRHGKLHPYPEMRALVHRCRYVWALTGTPTPNNAGELWTHFSALFGTKLAYGEWLKRYCTGYVTKFGFRATGNNKERLPELRAMLAQVMLRRKAKDVLPDLPPLTWGELTLPADAVAGVAGLAQLESQALAQEALDKAFARTGDMDLALLEATPAVATLRRETGRLKAAAVAKQIRQELLDGAMEKVVVFAVHHDVIDTLALTLAEFGAVWVDGRTRPKDRNERVAAFQKDPTRRVFVGQVQACGTAITLHAAHHTVFVEQSWVPGENAQAAKRCHRIGQKNAVFVRVASVAGTLDEAIDRVLTGKARAILELDEKAHPK